MPWNQTKRVGTYHVYDLPPMQVKVDSDASFTIDRRTWKSPRKLPNGTEVEAFCQVGCLSRRRPSFVVVRLPDGKVETWAATDNE